ncbi:receptor-like protein kinase FERONIA [Durio zibethinus]|uniref:Receptor-like protein kinase FERONIA n=1 Tax=Durio zibethinus TaxID=66656 RepID=A0A6P6BHZ3_DURZI|nr:receptor-like protein kinase FERONIA [Durio zibethinus]
MLLVFLLCYLVVPGLSEFLSCASSTTMSPNIQAWSLNSESKFNRPIFNRVSTSTPNDLELLKTSACIFRKQSNVTFPVSPGPKFVRLHFYPISYPSLNISKALFNVSVGSYTLLSISNSSCSNVAFDDEGIIKEYCVPVAGQTLNILFTPSSDYSDAYGFVNMIEVVSVPPKLYLGDLSLPLVGHPNQFYSLNYTALETLYRVNVGGSLISADHDSGLSRSWYGDQGDLFPNTEIFHFNKAEIDFGSDVPAYTAPKEVYTTARTKLLPDDNLNWSLPVDSGFCYLIRFHLFMEKSKYFVDENQIVVHIYSNYPTGVHHAEISLIQKLGVPIYRDFLVNFSRKYQGEMFLSISMQHNASAIYSVPLLNGLEIFKISDASNSLAGPNPFKARKVSYTSSEIYPKIMKIIFYILVAGVGSLTYVCYVCILLSRFQLQWYSYLKWKRRRVTYLQPSEDCLHFSLAEMKLATDNFSDALLIGSGGFGKVYKGCIFYGNTTVAIKRANPNSHQGVNEFQTEITTLSKLRHCHLVSLIGCCMEDNEMILVYNFMAGGTLADHLYKTKQTPLPWKQRLKICIGAARGLHYLHTGGKQTIIHRDVKTSNILLDENWEAKVSDFGLSKIGPNMMRESETHVSTLVKGSFGYLDPEYYRRRKLTEKSDVYSFGVVLFEVLFARPAVLPVAENEEEHYKVNLAEWAVNCYQMGTMDQNIDSSLLGQINPECFQTFIAISIKCLADKGSDRPSMGEVLCNLELAWQQQQQQQQSSLLEASSLQGRDNMGIGGNFRPMIDGQRCLPTGNSDPTPGAEFSEIIVPTGR